jgi:O-antigen/teichoic acid export membrane protein
MSPAAVTTIGRPQVRGLTARASLTAVAVLLDYAVRLAVGVVVTPFLVTYLGRVHFGVWEMLIRLVGYLSLADGRPMDALRLVLANQQSMADDETNRRTIGMALWVWALLLPVATAAGGVLIWLAPIVAHVEPGETWVVRLAAAVLVLNFLLVTLVALPEAALFGTNQGYRRMGVAAGVNVVGAVLTIVVLRRNLGLIGLGIVQIVLTLITAFVYLGVARRHIPWFGVARPARAEVRHFARLSGWSLAADAVAKLMLASDVLLLGFLTSAGLVTSYVLTGYAAQAVIGVLTLALGAAVPGLADVIGQRQLERARMLRADMIAVGWLAATVLGTTILLWNQAFVEMWVGPGHYAGSWGNALLVLLMAQTISIRSEAVVINAALRIRERALVSAFAAGLSCALAVVLVPRFGIPGLCLSLLGGRLAQSIGFPMIVNGSLGCAVHAGWQAALRPLLTMGLLYVSAAGAAELVSTTNWPVWMMGAAVTVAVTLPVAMFTGLPADTRRSVIARMRALDLRRGRV